MVAVELDLPSELCELLRKSCLDEVDGAFVYAELGLRRTDTITRSVSQEDCTMA